MNFIEKKILNDLNRILFINVEKLQKSTKENLKILNKNFAHIKSITIQIPLKTKFTIFAQYTFFQMLKYRREKS